jgi:hypothetical protein
MASYTSMKVFVLVISRSFFRVFFLVIPQSEASCMIFPMTVDTREFNILCKS